MSQLIDNRTAKQFDRLAPASTDMEMLVLGSLMLSTDDGIVAAIRSMLDREAFYLANHQIIFDCICELVDANRSPEPMCVRDLLISKQLWDEIGGGDYFYQIVGSIPDPGNGAEYASKVLEMYKRRQLITMGNRIVNAAFGPAGLESADALVESGMKELSEIIIKGRSASFHRAGDVARDVYDELEAGATPLLTTGIGALDSRVGGMEPGDMVILGARPSMGKSTAAKMMAKGIASAGIPVLLLSLEENRKKIIRNMLSAEAGVINGHLRAGSVRPEEWKPLAAGVARLNGLPLYIVDKARRLRDIRAVCTAMARRHGVRVVILDYLQRINVEGENRYEKATNASLGISDMLKELELAGIVLAQLNREIRNKEDKRPSMWDLRDSGQIEQDADGIILLHREDYYHIADADYAPTQEAEFIIAKWRDAARGEVVRLKSNLAFQRFEEELPV